MSRNRELRERRARLHAQATRLLEKGNLGSEDRAKFELMMAEIDALKGEIDRLELRSVDDELRRTVRPPEAAIGDPLAESVESREYREAFRAWCRLGPQITDEQRHVLQQRRYESRDMGIGTPTLGGYFVPQGFVYDVEVALKYYGPMLTTSKILDTATGNPLPYPTSNDVSVTGAIVGEGLQVTDADVSIGHILFGACKFTTQMVKVSLELMQDSAFDIEDFLKDMFAIRLGRILNTMFTVGTGVSEPTGILVALTNNSAPSYTAQGSAANTGGSQTGANSIGYVDLVELEHSVDPLYRRPQGAMFMCHDQTLKSVKEILDKYGRPLWVPGVSSNAPDTILGYPYAINNDMAQIGAGNTTVIFGALKKYMIRRVKEMAVIRLQERFADYGILGFLGFARY
jgi:HK97 family phage major capsid protein